MEVARLISTDPTKYRTRTIIYPLLPTEQKILRKFVYIYEFYIENNSMPTSTNT